MMKPLQVKTWSPRPGVWISQATLYSPRTRKRYRVTTYATERAVRSRMSVVGFSFSDIARSVGKLAKRVATSRALAQVSSLVSSGPLSMIIPAPIAASIRMASQATRALTAASQGNRDARAALQRASKSGDPRARNALVAAQRATGIQLRGGPSAPSSLNAITYPACSCR